MVPVHHNLPTSPLQDEQLLDYPSSSNPKTQTPSGSDLSVPHADLQPARKLTYKEALTSPHELRGVHARPVEASLPEASTVQPRPKLRFILVRPDPVSPPPSSRPRLGTTDAISMKASGQAVGRSKKGAATASSHEWQMVQRKVWRKKPLPPQHQARAHQRRQQRHLAHRRLQASAAMEKSVGALTRTTHQPSLAQLFKKRAVGRCFRCLAFDHRIADCRDPFKCLLCFKSGHRARHCRSHTHTPAICSSPLCTPRYSSHLSPQQLQAHLNPPPWPPTRSF
jgi:hypothetical protein